MRAKAMRRNGRKKITEVANKPRWKASRGCSGQKKGNHLPKGPDCPEAFCYLCFTVWEMKMPGK
jgi:hypothetical protein